MRLKEQQRLSMKARFERDKAQRNKRLNTITEASHESSSINQDSLLMQSLMHTPDDLSSYFGRSQKSGSGGNSKPMSAAHSERSSAKSSKRSSKHHKSSKEKKDKKKSSSSKSKKVTKEAPTTIQNISSSMSFDRDPFNTTDDHLETIHEYHQLTPIQLNSSRSAATGACMTMLSESDTSSSCQQNEGSSTGGCDIRSSYGER